MDKKLSLLPKVFIGPMTKNVVDSVLNYSKGEFGLIASRRQVEYNGGYVNNWTTKQFSNYIGNKLIKVRDHGGPKQGNIDDDGLTSFDFDCDFFDIIHIDPWKFTQDLQLAATLTAFYIKRCLNAVNSDLFFEVATEQSIRKFESVELDLFLLDLQSKLTEKEFSKILYCVIQSGTSLKGNNNTGAYNKERLVRMVNVCKKYGKLSKEHNGDYLPVNLIKEKMDFGLDAINIAPEFGLIETNAILDEIGNNEYLFDCFYNMCFNSYKWTKWVDSSFQPDIKRMELIRICGHYVLSLPEFITMKQVLPADIDIKIKAKIDAKLRELVKVIYA